MSGSVLEQFREMAERYARDFGGTLGLENAALLNVRYSDIIEAGLGQVSFDVVGKAIGELTREGLLTGGLLSRPTSSGSLADVLGGRVNQININVNGTVLNPEGTARAIQDVLQSSDARAGSIGLVPALGLE
jgi:hypothetical protein